MAADGLDFLFHPASVAVVGASADPSSNGYDFMAHLLNYGYKGKIYPISIKHEEIMGIKAYTSIEDVPGSVDYVICCIGIRNVPSLLASCARKGVRAVHIFAARSSETGRPEARALEAEIKKLAGEYGIRILGPNCLGIYCPSAGFSFGYNFPREGGNVGALVQSGGSSVDIVYSSALHGLRFSKVISYGNALDINEGDLLGYFAQDPETEVVIAFIEGLRCGGQRFLELVRRASAKKPVIICKGGRTASGARTALSHTASLAGSSKVWDIAIRQAGGIPVRDINDLVYMAVGFSFIKKPITGRRIGHGGAGGGRNVVSTDEWEDNGFQVVPLPREIREEFRRRGSQLWDFLDNPADRSIWMPGETYDVPSLLLEMAKHPDFDIICANMASEEHPYSKESFMEVMNLCVEGYIKLAREIPKPFLMVFRHYPLGTADMDHWRWQTIAQIRTRVIEEGIAFFPTVDKAAEVLNEMINYYQRRDGKS